MIIANGTIEVKRKSVGAPVDEVTGFPVAPAEVTWEAPMPCQWSANKRNFLGKSVGGDFVSAQYSILIEKGGAAFDAEQIRLSDGYGNVIGELSVIDIEELPAVNQIRIMV